MKRYDPAAHVAGDAAAAALWPPGPIRAALEDALHRAGDPERALALAVDVARARQRRLPRAPVWHRRAWIDLVVTLGGGSRALSAPLRRYPRLADRLASDPFIDQPKHGDRLRAELRRRLAALTEHPGAPATPERLASTLRRFRRREMMRIAYRDLSGQGSFESVLQELSDLASASFEGALSVLHPRLAAERPGAAAGVGQASAPAAGVGVAGAGASPGFCVLGMGKLGGEELNFSSDVDVLYVYEAPDADPAEAFGFHARLAEQVTRALGEVTDEGFVFRVDLDLRPEGRNGPVVNELHALEAYYETFGRTWERQAWLKARPVAGDPAVGEAALRLLRPFVYRRSLDLQAVRRVVALKDEMDRRIRARGDDARDLKLGRGGIRAIELVVQSLQLLFAGKSEQLRDRTTLSALDRLLFAGHLDEADVRALSDAYVFLRRAEHRIQMLDDRQTARLPSGAADRLALARTMGYVGEAPWEAFSRDLEAHRGRVQGVLERRFGHAEVDPEVPDALLAALDPEADEAERRERLADAGFADPHAAEAHLRRLRRRPSGPFGHAASPEAAHLGALLLAEAVRSPDPDQALRHLADLLEGMRASVAPAWLGLLRESPSTRRRLVHLFGTSDTLARDLVRRPEALDTLLLRARPSGRGAVVPLQEAPTPPLPDDGDPEPPLDALRRYRRDEVLRVGVADISGELDVCEVGRALTDVAEAILDRTVVLAAEAVRRRWGWPRTPSGAEVPLAVVGLGKLGGREMGYGSDLDLLFLYGGAGVTPSGMEAPELFSRLAQRLIAFITRPGASGTLYEIDTRLRPSGRQGMLVTSLDAFRDYHRRQGAVWERQALVRARPVAGPADFRAEVAEALAEAVWRPVDPASAAEDLRRLRARIEAEVGREGGGRRHPKAGHGGLLDIELLVQFLQLVHGADAPALRTPSTLDALRRLAEAGHLEAADAERLDYAWRFLRRLEGRLQLVMGRPVEHLPTAPHRLDGLARRMGYRAEAAAHGPGAALLDAYDEVTAGVRAVWTQRMGGTD